MKVIVFGCGLVGKAIVRELTGALDVVLTVVDVDQDALNEAVGGADVKTIVADLTEDGTARKLAEGQDIAVGAVPGWLGAKVLRGAIEAGCMIVDISFMPEDPFDLDELAKEKKVPVLVDCGVAPGLSNLLVGRATSVLDEVDSVTIMVGGLPVVRRLPYEYGAVFSPDDVLEEYTRPAFVIEGGLEIVKPALSDPELIEVHGLGTLEAFLTDGLRTLRQTIDAESMVEKTLRYPGHRERIQLLLDTGLLDDEPVEVNGVEISPRDVTAKLLRKKWQLGPGEEDITVLLVEVEGRKDDERVRYTYSLLDVYDDDKGVTSMARTTGYTCLAIVRMLIASKIEGTGVIPLEHVARDTDTFEQVLTYLKDEHGIVVEELIERAVDDLDDAEV